MARLIDTGEMLRRLESWNTDDEMDKALYNFTLNRIIEQPTVEAIPVDWIKEWCLSQDLEYVRIAIKKMMDNWNGERKEE